jgi:hypothetical protein
MNSRRANLVDMAFDIMDADGSGVIDLKDLTLLYDVTHHPDFKTGRKTKDQILRDLLDVFDTKGECDGVVTRQEFHNYYSAISASIDTDDYFELMIRNSWHISGGEGATANSANLRVLVTGSDGSERVVEVKKNLGLKQGDKEDVIKRLQQQGEFGENMNINIKVSINDGVKLPFIKNSNTKLDSSQTKSSRYVTSSSMIGKSEFVSKSSQEISKNAPKSTDLIENTVVQEFRDKLLKSKGLQSVKSLFVKCQEQDPENSGYLSLSSLSEIFISAGVLEFDLYKLFPAEGIVLSSFIIICS